MITPSTRSLEDDSLLDGIRKGDVAACEKFVTTFGPRMLAVAGRFLRCPQDRDDAVQEAFISAFRNLHQFNGESRLGTWLHTVVVRVCLMKLRSRRRRGEQSIDALMPQFHADGHRVGVGTAWSGDPERLAQTQETRALVRQCIEQLPESYRTVLLLRDIEEFDTEETARLLSLTVAAVKVRLHRARQALRARLDPHMSDLSTSS